MKTTREMATVEQSMEQRVETLEQRVETLEQRLAELVAQLAESKKAKKAKKAEPAEAGAEPKAPSAWNQLVAQTVAEMRQSGWESWTDLKGVVWPASKRALVKDKKGVESEAWVYDGGDHDGKPPSPSLGGMVRASCLKAQSDPEAMAKAMAYHAKLAERRESSSASVSGASAAEAPKKGRAKMTEEQKAAAAAKRAAKKAEAAAAAAEAASSEDEPKATEAQLTQYAAAALATAAALSAEELEGRVADAELLSEKEQRIAYATALACVNLEDAGLDCDPEEVALMVSKAASAAAEPKKAKKAKKAAPEAAEPAAAKPKRVQSEGQKAWGALVAETVAQMKEHGWEAWTDAKSGALWPASAASSAGHVFSDGPHQGKVPSNQRGGMSRASFLKAQAVGLQGEWAEMENE